MHKQSLDLVNTITAAQTRAVELDIEIALDTLKYSSWWSAVAAAGVGVIVATWKVAVSIGHLQHGRILLLITTAPLLSSACVGAYLNWRLNQSFACKREQISMFLKQQILLMTKEEFSDSGRVLATRALDLAYLEVKDQKICEDLESRDQKSNNVRHMLVAQQILTVLGYLLAMIVTLKLD